MTSTVTKALAAGAALFGGLLAGVTLNRALVQLPAWQGIGVVAWADFTRAENTGIGTIFYPALGLAAPKPYLNSRNPTIIPLTCRSRDTA